MHLVFTFSYMMLLSALCQGFISSGSCSVSAFSGRSVFTLKPDRKKYFCSWTCVSSVLFTVEVFGSLELFTFLHISGFRHTDLKL